ncbi:MAG TPA: GNAT family N-acetyltransferase [Myxococcus sp.]|nr:GNAT family N-acetyltransferase [Myxococcus sp.]
MKFLIDTNVLIPLEPTAPEQVEAMTRPALDLLRAIEEAGYQLFIHPDMAMDVERDRDEPRRRLRELLLKKYLPLPDPPQVPADWEPRLGRPVYGTNDWVDHRLLAALRANAISVLVTEDRRIHKKAERVGLRHRVATIGDALALVQGLRDKFTQPPPAVEFTYAYNVDLEDPFFDSLRGDYRGFDDWLRRCQEQHRRCWVVRSEGRRLAALCLIKDEQGALGIPGKMLKLCTFKVAPEHRGRRLGELLLKSVFAYVSRNGHDSIYVTAFEKQGELIALFEDFGFQVHERTEAGELALVKRLRLGTPPEGLAPLEFHVRCGPPAMQLVEPAFVIPIEPRFHNLLFPDADAQLQLQAGAHPFGNGLRKAYLCKAQTRQIGPGAPLLFYLSHSRKAVTVLGVAEETVVSSNVEEIAGSVGKRTVYPLREIETMCSTGEVLAILFRQASVLEKPIALEELIQNGVLRGPPQSITTVQHGGHAWLRQRIGL